MLHVDTASSFLIVLSSAVAIQPLLANLGLGMLSYVGGYEISFERIRGIGPARDRMLGWVWGGARSGRGSP